ncbi:MAG: hypothetical protein COV59_02420 [Candidatus Magasanikbacteria bacterium CG11_big_fil_rev_8_21_14_0_20_39_34]|uniref:4Fe-4S ferredoxin-type domain-containing protein n=1 Tax=Candidatus Magasanikbacteria bacterium CG11_big_fil_rev_8_21_14_0_20_39_34 TaxID=1974653 RepID=A0A2H0N7E2_9BACT|nr:MAG: hypothetical protein COV59_02420 [Candidatus Magasanikbacteria bacterium CG11_big_fil_rev_8_21_14_0_20_39_34]
MPKVTHDKGECIGCGSCTLYAEHYFEIDKEDDAKAHLIRSTQKGNMEILDIEDFEMEVNIDAARGCPMSCIKVLGDDGRILGE